MYTLGVTPATHAAVSAALARRIPSLPAALAVSFALHFLLDFVFHFEGFFPLSVPGRWTSEGAMGALFAALAAVAVPVTLWITRGNRAAQAFAGYALLMCLGPFEPATRWRLLWAILISAAAWTFSPADQGRRWVLCGLAGYLPDGLRHWIAPLDRLHGMAHYDGSMPLGAWLSLVVRGYWRVKPNDVIYDPYYQAGYAMEILLEAAALLAALWWLARPAASVADLPAVDHQRRAVDERGAVGK